MSLGLDRRAEWLEPDGLGGFASGTVEGIRTRRYRGLLLASLKPPTGRVDASFRPNQILAVGGLPFSILEGESARQIVDRVEDHLWTPIGLRSLAPGEPGYVAHYEGGVCERHGGYHQGTIWPWLLGPFVEAWLRVHGGTEEAKQEARGPFLEPLDAHLNAGLGHVSEIADADPPHTPRGCPFQAWSMGELLRLRLSVLA
jgi:glycogen debranching enzyme